MKKKLPGWFRYSIQYFSVKNPEEIDKELIKHKIDGSDVINVTAVVSHYGGHWYRVFYKKDIIS